jgi:hypothetical protein
LIIIEFIYEQQNCKVAVPSSQYVRKYVLPRIFTTVDLKKDNLIDFEEYVCAVALFRVGTTDDKIRGSFHFNRS